MNMEKNELKIYERPEAVVLLFETEHAVLAASGDTETLDEFDFEW